MSEILFENKNATVKKVSKETENGAKEYVYLDLLDENGNIKTSIPLKEPKKKNRKTIINKISEPNPKIRLAQTVDKVAKPCRAYIIIKVMT